jgi:sigma-E factor negative regulatory protein RseA
MKTEQIDDLVAAQGGQPEWLSALVDGEVRESEFDALFDAGGAGTDLHGRWHCYQLMGEAMRHAEPPVTLRAPQTFLTGVMAGLADGGATRSQLDSSATTVHVRAAAANDAVVRWKMLAGVASVAAVVAVSWSALSGAPGAPGNGNVAGVQLATARTEAQVPVALVQPVAVNTERGTLIRDPRLEQLLAEHRQFGGASALQMPAGFLRNATYEAAPQR